MLEWRLEIRGSRAPLLATASTEPPAAQQFSERRSSQGPVPGRAQRRASTALTQEARPGGAAAAARGKHLHVSEAQRTAAVSQEKVPGRLSSLVAVAAAARSRHRCPLGPEAFRRAPLAASSGILPLQRGSRGASGPRAASPGSPARGRLSRSRPGGGRQRRDLLELEPDEVGVPTLGAVVAAAGWGRCQQRPAASRPARALRLLLLGLCASLVAHRCRLQLNFEAVSHRGTRPAPSRLRAPEPVHAAASGAMRSSRAAHHLSPPPPSRPAPSTLRQHAAPRRCVRKREV